MIKVDESKCIHCGLCIKDCIGRNVLEFNENKIPFAKNIENCIKCQHCAMVCPVGALTFNNKNPENSKTIEIHNPDNLFNLIQSRRSVRQYKQENLPDELMSKLKNMLKWTPTGVNDHRLHFSFIDDINVMNKFRDKLYQKVKYNLENPQSAPEGIENFSWLLSGGDIIFRTAPHFVAVSTPIDAPCSEIDPIIALSYFELYAQSLGVGTCWCGILKWLFDMFKEYNKELLIPEGYKLGYVMLFGIPDVKYKRCSQPDDVNIVSIK